MQSVLRKGLFALALGSILLSANQGFAAKSESKPNVLFIAVDDLNDWIGCFGGHPQAITPNMDRLAKTGGMVFNKTYCAATVCCPSRSALMTGILPSDSGVYGNKNNLKNAEATKDALTISQYFSKHGYHSLSSGKIFHKHMTKEGLDEGQWAFDEWVSCGVDGAKNPEMKNGSANGLPFLPGMKRSGTPFDWGATTGKDEGTKDYQTALWAADKLQGDFDKPFFMAIGISKPHLPFFVPQKYFDMHPVDKVIVPEIHEDDLDDIKKENGENKFSPSDDYLRVKAADKFQEAAGAYLAAVSYADDCIGVVLDALEKSKYADNTIIVLWGDHGWFLGEKLKYRKTHLWEESTRCPLIIKVPGVTEPGVKCDRVVSLMDLYPTLVDLAGLPKKEGISGRNISPLLKAPQTEWNYPALTTMGKGNHSIRTERYRYIRYNDGIEELYDHENDPMEWTNLAAKPQSSEIIKELKKWLPKTDAEESPQNTVEKKKNR